MLFNENIIWYTIHMDYKRIGEDNPINEQDERILAQVMHNIILATYQLRLYDNENAIFLQSLDTVVGFMEMLAGKFGHITLGVAENKLIINGKESNSKKEEKIWADNFIGLMKKSEIRSVDFLPGIFPDEIKIFLKGLAKKKGLQAVQEELAAIKAEHVKLNINLYVTLDSQDVVLEKGADLLASRGENVEDILSTIQKAAEEANNSMSLDGKETAKNKIIGRLLSIDVPSLIKLIEKQMPFEVEKVIEESLAGLPFDKIKEITESLVNQYSYLKQQNKENPEKCTEASVTHFRDIFHRYTLWLKNQQVMFDLYGLVMEKGAEELAPPWMKPSKEDIKNKEDVNEMVKSLVGLDPQALLSAEMSEDLNNTLGKLAALGETKTIKQLLNKVSTNLASEDKSVRTKAAAVLKNGFDKFKDSGNREITRYLSERLRDVLDTEKDSAIYGNLSECVKEEINQEILEGNYENAVRLVGIFKKHELDNNKDVAAVLAGLIEKENVDLLIEDLVNPKAEVRDRAFEILVKLKEQLYPQFIKHITETENLRKRRILAEFIRSIGDKAVSEFACSITDKSPLLDIYRIIELLDIFPGNPQVLQKLDTLTLHFDFKIRKEAFLALSRIGNEQALAIITKGLSDTNLLIRQEVTRILGNAGYQGAFTGLKNIAAPKYQFTKEEEETLQIEACLALGKINHPEALKLLKEILYTALWQKPKSVRIRGAAAQAIGLIGGEQARKILSKARRDRNKYVKQAAEAALAGS